ncbi:alpha/beta hydrolase [Candidatus Roizmanbacteria bacterium]|nr:alpha/beta hydrolase [Candidatus Roizmanbacteria bacterium]
MDVLILHGWKLSGSRFEPLVQELKKKNLRVFAPDMPGFGKGKKLERPYALSDYVAFVHEYIQQHKLKKPVIIGHSFGGRVSIILAAEYPELIEKLVLTGVPGVLLVSRAKLLFFLGLAKMGGLVFRLPVLSQFESLARKVLYRVARASDYQTSSGNLRETFKKIIAEDLVVPMRKISCPVLLLWGKDDRNSPEEIAKKMRKFIPKVKLDIVEGEAHGFPFENPKEFSARVIDFINKPYYLVS